MYRYITLSQPVIFFPTLFLAMQKYFLRLSNTKPQDILTFLKYVNFCDCHAIKGIKFKYIALWCSCLYNFTTHLILRFEYISYLFVPWPWRKWQISYCKCFFRHSESFPQNVIGKTITDNKGTRQKVLP